MTTQINANYLEQFLKSNFTKLQIKQQSKQGTVTNLHLENIRELRIPLPPTLQEQKAIAKALSDVDALIDKLQALITKKQAIKEGSMQRLLTPPHKGGQRLPGFEGGWEEKKLGEVVRITTGSKNTQDKINNGKYPFYVRSQVVERINTYSFDGEGILTAGDGVGTGKIFHYVNGKIDYHQRVYLLSDFPENVSGYFIYLIFKNYFYQRIMQMTAKSSVDSVRREMISEMIIYLPESKDEQKAISKILSEMDLEIEKLKAKKAKYEQIKEGMMQELLTGKTRLV